MKNTYKNTRTNTCTKHSNKNKASVFVSCLLWTCALFSLSACGQRGSLYIPNTPEAAQRSSIGDVLTNKPATATANPNSVPTTAPETAPTK